LTDKAIDFLTELHQNSTTKTLLLDERKNNKHYLMQVPYLVSQSKQQTFENNGVQQQFHKIY
jgi:hypothetical protein